MPESTSARLDQIAIEAEEAAVANWSGPAGPRTAMRVFVRQAIEKALADAPEAVPGPVECERDHAMMAVAMHEWARQLREADTQQAIIDIAHELDINADALAADPGAGGAGPWLVEPEAVAHNLCSQAEPISGGGHRIAQCRLVRRLDDGAGHQRVYVCERCGAEIAVDFPPAPIPAPPPPDKE